MPGSGIFCMSADYGDYLKDESRLSGIADTISFPETVTEVIEIVQSMNKAAIPVTVQGSRTGITAGAVPGSGHILNLTKMNCITGMRVEGKGSFFLTVQPGVILCDLRKAVAEKNFNECGWSSSSMEALRIFRESGEYFFPTDPTEASASIGGMTACNASGARSFHYGPMRKYVEALCVVLADGRLLRLSRGRQKAQGRAFFVETEDGGTIEGMLPGYDMPAVKNASGYFILNDMDLIDLFIGSEGTLGIVVEIELRLLPLPASIWGFMAFFRSEGDAVSFIRGIRGEKLASVDMQAGSRPAAIEFFNHDALDLLRTQKNTNPAFSEIPDMPPEFHTAVYTEYHGADEDSVEGMVMEAAEFLLVCGGSEGSTWMASSERELLKLQFFRHAVPEAVNLLIDSRRKTDPKLTKLGTDMAVPDDRLSEMLELYNNGLAQTGLESVMFGHIGNNHVHVNILPNSQEEYDRGKLLYLDWARAIVKMGGTVSAEHGIGKLKTVFLKEMYGSSGVEQMKVLKKIFDPGYLLNPGNLFGT